MRDLFGIQVPMYIITIDLKKEAANDETAMAEVQALLGDGFIHPIFGIARGQEGADPKYYQVKVDQLFMERIRGMNNAQVVSISGDVGGFSQMRVVRKASTPKV